jgi:hypothetical protein
MWDLVPFSFVLDKVHKVGDSLEYFDTSALFIALDIEYSTHSISCTYNFTEEDMEEHGFTSIPGSYEFWGENLVGYKTYVRYAMNGRTPPLGPTRLPILSGGGISDWATAGALAYKFI